MGWMARSEAMAAAIEPLEVGRDWQPAAGAALGAAEDATRDAIARAELAAAVQGATGLPAVLADAARHVDPAGGGADLVLAQARADDGPRGGGWRALPEAMLGQLPLIWNGVHGSAARELEHMAADPRLDAPARAHLGEAAALAAEHPFQAPAILERALDNLAVGLDDPRRVELLTGEPVGPQVLPGRTIEEAGPTVHEGPRIPDDQGPQVQPGPAIEEQRPQVLADPVQEPIHDGVWADPIADPDVLGDGIVAMADPNNARAVRLEQEVHDRLREAFPDADIRRNVIYYNADGRPVVEIDDLIDGVPVEVTIGRGKDKQRQAEQVIEHVGAPSVVMGPRVGGTVERELRERYDVTVVRTLDDLVEALRARGVGQ